TPDDPADDNSFDEASLIMHVSNSTTSSPLTTDWVAVAQAISSAGTGAGYTFTQGEVMQAFGAWEYSVAPDEALNALNDPDQDTNTINGSLTIDQLLAHISAAATDSYVNWPQVTSSLESGELSSVEYQFTVAGPAVNFQYAGGMKGDYVSNALGVGLGSHEWLYYYGPYAPTPTEVAASLNDPDYDSVDENNFTPVWVMTYFEGPLLSTSEIFNNPDSTGDYENYWLFHEFEFVDPEGWQWPYSSPVETALPLLNDPDQDGNSVAKFTPGSFAKDRDNQFVYKATSDTPNGSVTNWGWVAQNLSNAGLNGYLLYGDTQGAPAVNVPATPGYTITADQIKQALGLPNTSDRAWPYPRSEAEVMSDLNNPSSAGFSGVNWSNNNFTADFILDMIEAYTSNGVTDWSGVATALNQDGVADGTTDDQPDNSFAGAAADYTQTSYLPAILTGETGYSALTAISTWSFPAAEAEALAKINQISQRVTTSGPPVQYQDFTALDIINYVGQYTGQLSNQTDWDGVAAQLNNGASISTGDPNTSTIFSGFSGSWLKSTLGFLAWGFPRSEVAALMHLNSIDSISGEATNTFTTMDVLSALDGNGFEEPHVADFDFQLAADTLNNQELDAIGQLDQNDLLTALYWDFPAAPDQALDFFNDADKDGTEENAFVIKDLLTAIGFEVNAEIIDWALAAADLNDPDNDGSDDNALTSSLVELGFGFGAMDSELALAYVNLLPGINMISPPNQPQTAYTARSLIQHIHTSKHADDDDANIVPGEFVLDENGDPTATPKTDVNWLIRYDAIDQNFDAYVWAIDNMQEDTGDVD
ncbi:MAG: hypothetical protein QGF90_12140, partial [Gammaproteobacteria bacterium]|nr:hypothetical protein [Gammaproteobacteria bacterium]